MTYTQTRFLSPLSLFSLTFSDGETPDARDRVTRQAPAASWSLIRFLIIIIFFCGESSPIIQTSLGLVWNSISQTPARHPSVNSWTERHPPNQKERHDVKSPARSWDRLGQRYTACTKLKRENWKTKITLDLYRLTSTHCHQQETVSGGCDLSDRSIGSKPNPSATRKVSIFAIPSVSRFVKDTKNCARLLSLLPLPWERRGKVKVVCKRWSLRSPNKQSARL